MQRTLQRLGALLGSLPMAVGLLIAIAGVLAWGTFYEARFGTAAVQRFLYRTWWFQSLLGFLAVNLAIAALSRYPWQRRHLPFVSAHVGIILILLGGILGGRFGVEGQLVIPEGQSQGVLELPTQVLVVRESNPGADHVFPTHFETTAWVHEPRASFQVPLAHGPVELTVDRYYPNAAAEERVTDDGISDNPAIQLVVRHGEQQEAVWLFARDPERFGARWGQAHVLLLESGIPAHPRGVIAITLPGEAVAREIPVPERFDPQPISLEDTPYVVIFKDYFADFAITQDGPVSRSDEPNNPAVAFLLAGPEGTDAHLVFARHPDFEPLHGLEHAIPASIRYHHPAEPRPPPQAIVLRRAPSGALAAVLTGPADERQALEAVELGRRYDHPWLGYQFEVAASYARARLSRHLVNRDDEVKAPALHVIARDGEAAAETWLEARTPADLPLGRRAVTVEYRQDRRELPFAVTLLDFRKTDYPGTRMAAAFESDVELFDPQRGVVLLRTIRMNHPLRYRGFSFYQSSYIEGPTETTVLSVRNDPGTPLVYAGFLIVIAGVVTMFIQHRHPTKGSLR